MNKNMNKNPQFFSFIIIFFFVVTMAFFASFFPLDQKFASISAISVILFSLPCYYGLIETLGTRSALQLILSMSIFCFVLENLAIITGIPYGDFSYGSTLGQYFGRVPWTVSFAWTPILFGAISLTQRLHKKISWISSVGIAALLMTALDFILDPGSVALGFWTWTNSTGFYGVPWTNFSGWLLSSSIAITIVWKFLASQNSAQIHFTNWTHRSYMLIAIFWTAICIFERLWIPALIGSSLVTGVLILDIKKENVSENI